MLLRRNGKRRGIAMEEKKTGGLAQFRRMGDLRKLAKSVEYQYILDLNYTRFTV